MSPSFSGPESSMICGCSGPPSHDPGCRCEKLVSQMKLFKVYEIDQSEESFRVDVPVNIQPVRTPLCPESFWTVGTAVP